jgi:hypothetical protein
MTVPLSPAAQAVLDAAAFAEPGFQSSIAAALRAATKQPYEVPPWYRGDDYLIFRNAVTTDRNRLLAIANELEAH